MSLTVGIIGCGRMGRVRAHHAAEFGARVSAVYDTDVQRAATLAAEFSDCTVARDESSFPWSTIEAVFLCTPPGMRESSFGKALAHRAAIFVEKPFALDAARAFQMAEAIADAGVTAAVGYMNRYRESVRVARETLGRAPAIAISAFWTCGKYVVPWWENPEISGGPFNEQATHIVDLVRYLAGEITEARAFSDGQTRVAAALRTDSSCVATLLYSCEAAEKHIGIDVVTRSGHLRLSGWDFALTENTIDGRLVDASDDAFRTETHTFLRRAAGQQDARILCSPAAAAATQRAVDLIRSSYAPLQMAANEA